MSDYIKIEIGFGTGSDKSGKQLDYLQVFTTCKKIEKLALDLFGGYTWIESAGGWRDENDKNIQEPGRVLTIQCNSDKQHEARQLAVFIRDALNQSCVCLTITPVQFTFV